MELLPSSGLSHELPELGWNWLKGNAWKWQHLCVCTPRSAGTPRGRGGRAMLCADCFHLRCLQHQLAGGWWGWGDPASTKSPLEGALAGTGPCSPAPCSALAVGMWQWSLREIWALPTGPSTARCWPWAPVVFINRPIPCRKLGGGSCGAEVVCFPFLALSRTGYF